MFQETTHKHRNIISGAISGTTCAIVFHPWDRASFLAQSNNRSFFAKSNFENIYHGVLQTACQRAFLGSAYYIVQNHIKTNTVPALKDKFRVHDVGCNLLIGLIAGTTHGIITNPVASVKTYTWGHHTRNFRSSIKEMYKTQGISAFIRGMESSIARDSIHGSTYEIVRNVLRSLSTKDRDRNYFTGFLSDSTAACLGTILSAPFNHVRTVKFSTPLAMKTPLMKKILIDVLKESESYTNIPHKIHFLRRRFLIGIGTIRASLGMALGQMIFDKLMILI